MWHIWKSSATLWDMLVAVDEELASTAASSPCANCGEGRLHRADYPRKPRGLPAAAEASFALRFSLCCAADGCRRRTTPPSVRFLGRKVYVGFVVVIASVFAVLDALGKAADAECRRIPRRTVARWQLFWMGLPTTQFWCDARSRLASPIAVERLPGSLLDRFDGSANEALTKLLRFIAPITVPTWAKIPRVV